MNAEDDILISGTTSYDSGADDDKLANDLSLLRLKSEWDSSRSYAARVANLQAGTGSLLAGSGLSLKKGITVLGDTSADRLTGSNGQEWFFIDAQDQVSDLSKGEVTV